MHWTLGGGIMTDTVNEQSEYDHEDLPIYGYPPLGLASFAIIFMFSCVAVGVLASIVAYVASWLFGSTFSTCFFAALGCALFGMIFVGIVSICHRIDVLGSYIEMLSSGPLSMFSHMMAGFEHEDEMDEDEYLPPELEVRQQKKRKKRGRKRS